MSSPLVLPRVAGGEYTYGENCVEYYIPRDGYDEYCEGMLTTKETQSCSTGTTDYGRFAEYEERQHLPSADCGHPTRARWASPPNYYGHYYPGNFESWGPGPLNQSDDGYHTSTVACYPPTTYRSCEGEEDGIAYTYHYHQSSEMAMYHGPQVHHQPCRQYVAAPKNWEGAHPDAKGGPPSHLARSPIQWIHGPPIPDDVNRPHRRAKTFPEKLMNAFVDFPKEDAVAWLPDGKSFVVVDQKLFVNDILNKFFKATKYSSFIRKLHRWGFVRLTSGTGTDCFHHPLFTINDPTRAAFIKCATPQHRKSVFLKHSANSPSLAGVERFIRAKAASVQSGGRCSNLEIRSSAHKPQHGDPAEVTSSSSNSLYGLSREGGEVQSISGSGEESLSCG